MSTSVEEFDLWVGLLPWEPYLIPLQKHSKVPDVPAGESWKDPKFKLSVEQARERLRKGLNVGVVAVGDYVIWDHDDPEKFDFPADTLVVMTRNGKLHKYFVNAGDVKNADGKGKFKGCGEIRAEWKYVVAPGSYVPPDDDAKPGATGLYMVVKAEPPALLSAEDIPPEFQPGFTEKEEVKKPEKPRMTGSFRNQYGWSIEDIRKRDRKLDELLSEIHPAGYPSPSEADMATLSKLLFWGYTEDEAVEILKHFRGREKLEKRQDYIEMTLAKIRGGETIRDYVDTRRWNPKTGYKLPFEMEPEHEPTAPEKARLIFEVTSKKKARVKVVKGNKALTAWVTLKKPEDLRTSRNAKIVRDILKEEHPADWRLILERTIENIEAAFAARKSTEERTKKIPEEDPNVEAEVDRILNSDNILDEIKRHLDNIVAGEDNNKLTIFLLLLSGKVRDPSLKQMILLKGEAGAGKTTLMSIADLFKTKNVGRFTAHALDYSELEGYEVLKLKEIGVMDLEQQGVSTLKFLSADDKGYTVEFVVRDPETGEFVTKQHRIPPITVISSTTRVSLDPQYTRRNWIISPDESEEQTIRIREWIAKHETEKEEVLLGLRKETSYDFSFKVLKRLLEQIEICNVILPFKRTLMHILDTSKIRVRGDYRKILSLVKLYCVLIQRRLPKIQTDKSHIVIATPQEALRAMNIILEPLISMTAELDKRTKKVLDILDELKLGKGDVIDRSRREEIAIRGGWSDRTVRAYLNELERRGYLSGEESKPKKWYLLHDPSVIRRKLSVISAKIEIADELICKMKEEAQEWLKKKLAAGIEGGPINYLKKLTEIVNTFPYPKIPSENKRGVISLPAANADLSEKNRQFQELPKYHWQKSKLPMEQIFHKFHSGQFVEEAMKMGYSKDEIMEFLEKYKV